MFNMKRLLISTDEVGGSGWVSGAWLLVGQVCEQGVVRLLLRVSQSLDFVEVGPALGCLFAERGLLVELLTSFETLRDSFEVDLAGTLFNLLFLLLIEESHSVNSVACWFQDIAGPLDWGRLLLRVDVQLGVEEFGGRLHLTRLALLVLLVPGAWLGYYFRCVGRLVERL